jgi:hypothetical protein
LRCCHQFGDRAANGFGRPSGQRTHSGFARGWVARANWDRNRHEVCSFTRGPDTTRNEVLKTIPHAARSKKLDSVPTSRVKPLPAMVTNHSAIMTNCFSVANSVAQVVNNSPSDTTRHLDSAARAKPSLRAGQQRRWRVSFANRVLSSIQLQLEPAAIGWRAPRRH